MYSFYRDGATPPPQQKPAAPQNPEQQQWNKILNDNKAGSAENAEDFTKQVQWEKPRPSYFGLALQISKVVQATMTTFTT